MSAAKHTPRRIKHPIFNGRSLEGICVLAGLVGYEVPVQDANLLSAEQQSELEVWAERSHLCASDNAVRVPPRPDWLPGQPWQGPEDTWGNGPTPVDCAAIAKATAGTRHTPAPRLTSNQLAILEWFSTREWVPHREWRAEMTTTTPRSLCNHGLLDVDHTRTTTHYRINEAGRAAVAQANGSAE